LLFIAISALCEDGSHMSLRCIAGGIATVTANQDSAAIRITNREPKSYWLGDRFSLRITSNSCAMAFCPDGNSISGPCRPTRLQAKGSDLRAISERLNCERRRNHWDNLDSTITRRSIWK
jgi:hypothetical protein